MKNSTIFKLEPTTPTISTMSQYAAIELPNACNTVAPNNVEVEIRCVTLMLRSFAWGLENAFVREASFPIFSCVVFCATPGRGYSRNHNRYQVSFHKSTCFTASLHFQTNSNLRSTNVRSWEILLHFSSSSPIEQTNLNMGRFRCGLREKRKELRTLIKTR